MNDDELSRLIYENCLKTMAEEKLLSGELESLEPEEIVRRLDSELKELIFNKQIDISLKIDHTDNLETTAKNYLAEEKLDRAALFFATCFEHKINFIIFTASAKYSELCQQRLLKLNVQDKCTWVLELLNLPPIEKDCITTIRNVSEIRNRYIHYKWADDSLSNDEDFLQISKSTEILRILDAYAEEKLFKGRRQAIFNSISDWKMGRLS